MDMWSMDMGSERVRSLESGNCGCLLHVWGPEGQECMSGDRRFGERGGADSRERSLWLPSGGLGVPGSVADSGLSRIDGSLCDDVAASMLPGRGTHNGEDCKEQTPCNVKRVGPQCMIVAP
jgi:hypothetical protein